MKKRRGHRSPNVKRDNSTSGGVAVLLNSDVLCSGYTSLANNPEVQTACRRIAELVGSMTIHLMRNGKDGDERIKNELSRLVDITPMHHMTRSTWMQGIVMTMLLYGRGNAVVVPHTYEGYLQSLEPISADRVSFTPIGYGNYRIGIDGKDRNPSNLLHFVYNPDRTYLWKGQGVTVVLKDVANNLRQAQKTTNAFMQSNWKPSIIVKVDALTDEFSSPEGRKKLLESYVKPANTGEPWLIPAEQFSVEQVKPLSIADLAISDTVTLDKKTVASVLGVPPFLLGVGDYSKDAWNSFIQNTIRPIALTIQQELTNKLLISPDWYFRFNIRSLYEYDLQTIASVYGEFRKQGLIDGNEARDAIGLSPRDGLNDLVMLENYIPVEKLGDQKKLTQEGE